MALASASLRSRRSASPAPSPAAAPALWTLPPRLARASGWGTASALPMGPRAERNAEAATVSRARMAAVSACRSAARTSPSGRSPGPGGRIPPTLEARAAPADRLRADEGGSDLQLDLGVRGERDVTRVSLVH